MNQQHFVTFTIKTISDLDKHIKTMDKAFKSSSGLTKAFNDIGKATKIATVAISALTSALSAFISTAKAVAEFGQQFTNFSIATGKGAVAIKNLNAAYSELNSTSKGLLVSMADLAEFQSKFASKSVTNMILSGTKEANSAFATLQSQLTKAVGKQGAQNMILGMMDSLKDAPDVQKALMDKFGQGGSSGLKLLAGGDDIAALMAVASALDTIENNTDKGIDANMKYNEMVATLDKSLTDLAQKFVNAFGDDMIRIITSITNAIEKFANTGASAIDWVSKRIEELTYVAGIAAGVISGFMLLGPVGALIGGAGMAAVAAADQQRIKTAKSSAAPEQKQGPTGKEIFADEISKRMLASRKELELATANMAMFSKNTEAASAVMDSLSSFTREAGGNTEKLNAMIALSVKNADDTLASSGEALRAAAKHVSDMKKAMEEANTDPNSSDKAKADAQQFYIKALQREAEIEKSIVAAKRTKIKAQEAELSKQEFNLEMAEKQEAVYQRQLEISKAMPGALGANLESIKGVVEQIDKEKAILEDMAKKWAEREQTDKDTEYARKKRLEIEEKIKNKQLQQLNLLKELRDGYLQAVEASAIGAGRFEKILFTQEKNLGLALDMRNAKANFLLGQVGSAASQFSKLPGQFDPNNFGGVNAVGGGAMTPQAWNAQSQANQSLPKIEEYLRRIAGAASIPTGAPAEVLKGAAANRPSSPSPTSGPSSNTRDIGGNGSSELREISRLAAIAADKIDSTVEVNADVTPQKRGAPVHNP